MSNAVPPHAPHAAVLCSAGLDSAVLLAHEAQHGRVTPVYVSVGLAWEPEERRALETLVTALSRTLGIDPIAYLEFPVRDLYPRDHWAVRGTPPAYDTADEDVYLPGRNLMLLTRAGLLCATRHIPRLALGPLAGNPFPDATPEFFATMARALSLGLAFPIEVVTPFAGMHKSEVISLGQRLGVPLELSLSCMRPEGGVHCGACSKCRERHDAFVEARIADPTVYAARLPR